MMWVGLLLILCYAMVLALTTLVWWRMENVSDMKPEISVTVLVPVRNEEKSIEGTLNSILDNQYPSDLFELIVIDDHSIDETAQIVQSSVGQVKLIQLEKNDFGKKAAIEVGVNQAKGDLIICTDGDSEVQSHWIQAHLNSYLSGRKLSFGPVVYQGDNLSSDLLNMELSALVTIGAVSSRLGRASMINGCNYSFDKKTFLQVNGFEGNKELATGDDEFLLRKMSDQGKEFGFIKDKRAIVSTEQPQSIKTFVSQRRRWASKWKYHKDINSRLMPFLVLIFYVVFLLSLTIGFVLSNWQSLWMLIGLKIISDMLIVWSYYKFMSKSVPWWSFVLMEIIYPFYVLFFGLTSNFGTYQWKGRVHKI